MTAKQPITVMLLECDTAIREVLESMCELWSVQSLSFNRPDELHHYLDQEKLPEPVPDIALVDVRSSFLWGRETFSRIRKHPSLGTIGLILTTAYCLSPEQEQEIMQFACADLLIYKPFPRMDKLLTMIEGVGRNHNRGKDANST